MTIDDAVNKCRNYFGDERQEILPRLIAEAPNMYGLICVLLHDDILKDSPRYRALSRAKGIIERVTGEKISWPDEQNSRLIAAAPEMYELLKVWTQIGAQPTLMIAKDKARKLLTRIDGKEAHS